jgi:hypothetical protein
MNLTLHEVTEVRDGYFDYKALREQLPSDEYSALMDRRRKQLELVERLRRLARQYLVKADNSMNLAFQARDEYVADRSTDAGLDAHPIYKGHVNDNRWYMEWSRVYDARCQTEMMSYQMGLY